MNQYRSSRCRLFVLSAHVVSLFVVHGATAQAPPEAVAAFQRYAGTVEARLLAQHASALTFLVTSPQQEPSVRRGELSVEQLSPAAQPAGAMLHHWRGTAVIPGATPAQFEQLLRDFKAYPHVFAPEVTEARSWPLGQDRVQARVRVRQTHVMTVVLDATYDVSFSRPHEFEGYSTSRSTRISEMDAPGTGHERVLQPADEHGFLWRLNTYWTYQQRGDDLWIQIESVSLSRAIPTGLRWALRSYVTSIPRDSLQFTLRSATAALRSQATNRKEN